MVVSKNEIWESLVVQGTKKMNKVDLYKEINILLNPLEEGRWMIKFIVQIYKCGSSAESINKRLWGAVVLLLRSYHVLHPFMNLKTKNSIVYYPLYWQNSSIALLVPGWALVEQ